MKTFRNLFRSLTLAAFGLALLGTDLQAANGRPPEKMSYQSYLVDANGLPLGNNGPKNYDVIFRIYNDQAASAAGNKVWTEQQTITVDNGYFSILLGEGNAYASEARPPLSSVFTNLTDASDRFIEMTVKGIGAGGTDSTIAPRVRLLPAAYAYLATTAVNANNLVNSGNATVVNISGQNVGINQANPGAALDVNGTFKATSATVSGNLTAGSLTTSGALTASGTVTAGNLTTSGTLTAPTINASGTVTAGTFVGDGTIPVGGIILWSGTVATIPSGWTLCNGNTVNGQLTPDLRNRFVIGAGSTYNPKDTGGNASITLSVAQLPPHTHGYNDYYFSENRDGNWGWFGSGDSDWDNRAHGVDRTTASTGSGSAIDIRPPYYALAYIMRVR